jgi:hypothetical protein
MVSTRGKEFLKAFSGVVIKNIKVKTHDIAAIAAILILFMMSINFRSKNDYLIFFEFSCADKILI